MTKRRMIHSCIWQSEHFATLTAQQRLLWIGLITTADDQGRGRAHSGLVRAAVFPFDNIALDVIAGDLVILADLNLIILYEIDSKLYYQIIKWWEYQSMQWAAPSEYPAPEDWEDKWRYHSKGRQIEKSESWDKGKRLPKCLGRRLPKPQEEEEEEVKDKEGAKSALSPASADWIEFLDFWKNLFPTKLQPRRATKSLMSKHKTRMKDSHFRENWKTALIRVSKITWVMAQGWFCAKWFLKNDGNYLSCLNGEYDRPKPQCSNGGERQRPAERDLIEHLPFQPGDWGTS